MQSLVKCLDHTGIVSDTGCSQAKVVFGYDDALKCQLVDTGAVVAGRAGSVQPSPRAGDGFSTPVVGSSHKYPSASTIVLEAVRARALAAHASGSKAEDKAGPSLTDNLLNL